MQMSSTGDYLRELADQIDRGVTLCLDIKLDPDPESLNRHLHLIYRSLADVTNSAGLATAESEAQFRAALQRAQESGQIPKPPQF
jgi:hypothetical protein